MKCVCALHKICAQQALLPQSVQIIAPDYKRFYDPQRYGGRADIWKGDYQGRKVAAKVLRVYVSSNLDNIISVCHCLKPSRSIGACANRSGAGILQGSCYVERPRQSQRAPIFRSDDEQQVFHNDIRVDGQQ